MGKGKKKAKSLGEARPATELAIGCSESISFPEIGDPCCLATLVAQSGLERIPAGRILLPPQAFLTAQLSSAEVVAVALSSQSGAAEELPGLKNASEPLESKQSSPLSLWAQLGLKQSVQTSSKTPTESSGKGWAPGAFFLLATAWPGKLPQGKATVSAELQQTLGGTAAAGKQLLIFKAKQLEDVPLSFCDLAFSPTEEDGPAVNSTAAMQQRRHGETSHLARPAEWLAEVLAAPRSRELLERAAAWHLAGRRLLAGNPVPLPVLGRTCFFEARLAGGEHSPWACVTMDEKVPVRLRLDAAAQPEAPLPAEAAASAAGAAAAAAVGGGEGGPAAIAASRAARAGAAVFDGEGFAALGGLDTQIQALDRLVRLPLQSPALYEEYGIEPPRGVLLHGPPGTGKTRLAAATAAAAQASLFVINGPDIVSAYYGQSEESLRGVFAAARAAAPSVVFIDEIDALMPAREGDDAPSPHAQSAASGASARAVASLVSEMRQPSRAGVIVLAATNRPGELDAALRRPGRFDQELEVGVPSPAQRADILRKQLAGTRHVLDEGEISGLAARAHGFVGADLAALCTEASFAALRRAVAAGFHCRLEVTHADFGVAETLVRPSALREVALEVPRVRWTDVGGLEEVKARLREAVQWPQEHGAALKRLGAKAPSGVLLFGPPGCSKTLLARAVATEARLNFLAVKGPELLSKYVGDSEKAVTTLFARARAAAPSIVFFDEIDGLAGARSSDGGDEGGSVGDRVVAQLLTEMDGLQARGGVVVLAASNRPDRIDAALLRPGRFDRLLFVPPPDAAARQAILAVHTRSTPLASDVDVHRIANACEGYTGADLSSVVREAALAALVESLSAEEVGARHFTAALKVVDPSVSLTEADLRRYRGFER